MRAFLIPLIFLVLWTGFAHGEMREFTGANGKTLKAELVSHTEGNITMKLADGREITVLPNIFGPDDQLFIKGWLEKTPETVPVVKYNFRFEVDRKKVSGRTKTEGSYLIKNEKWVYEVQLTNLSRDTAKNLTVMYRQFRSNHADGDSSAFSSAKSDWVTDKSEIKVAAAVDYGKRIEFKTKEMKIDRVDYQYGNYDYKDEIKGLMIRVVDANGNVVSEWAEPVNTLKGKTWENTSAKKDGGSTVIIR
ncbi:MAG: hypothetical protein ACI8UO_002661 [Verrucomicrobiales bacterium]|jgi:hypothetical protein